MKYPLFVLLIVACTVSCSQKEQQEVVETTIEVHKPDNKPKKKLNIGFLAINGVYNSELMAPYDIFQHTIFHTELGMETFIVSPSLEPIETFEGITVTPHYSFKDAPDIDVLVVPSAEHNMDADLEDENLISWVKAVGQKAQFVMSLCDGAFILAQAGLLEGLKCTTFPTDIERFKETFPQLDVYKDISFVHDGKAITSAGGAKSYDPSLYLVEYLYGKSVAEGVGRGLVIDWKLSDYKAIYPQ
jgi:transcriptional regulator GlxA family with amidase domain